MCGIIACLSKNCIESLLNGLKQLQNRGYDSAGITTIYENKFITDHSKYIILKNYKNNNIFLKIFLEILNKIKINQQIYNLQNHINLYTQIYNIYSFSDTNLISISEKCDIIYLLLDYIENKRLVRFINSVYAYPFRMIKINYNFSSKMRCQCKKEAKKISNLIN